MLTQQGKSGIKKKEEQKVKGKKKCTQNITNDMYLLIQHSNLYYNRLHMFVLLHHLLKILKKV